MDSIILQLIAAFIVTVSATIMLHVPRKLILQAGYAGVIGYGVYLYLLEDLSTVTATLFACIAVSLTGQFMARRYKAPVTIFYIPAFFLFVPGSSIYLTALNFIRGDINLTISYLVQTLSIAGAIALGVFLVDSLLDIYSFIHNNHKRI